MIFWFGYLVNNYSNIQPNGNKIAPFFNGILMLKTQFEFGCGSLDVRLDKMPDFACFNRASCCFTDDGIAPAIRLKDGCMRLVRLRYKTKKESERLVLEESKLTDLKLDNSSSSCDYPSNKKT
jgi:hypothetical protein